MLGPIIIRSIKLNNILSHTQTTIEFPLGLTALVGPNGAGKSSIIDSIIYALFILPQNIRGFRGSSKKSFLRAGASTGSIEVELSVGGKRYAVYRAISITKGDDAVIYEVLEDGRRRAIASGVQQVVDYVKKLLSVPSADSIRYTIVSRQNEIAKLLEEPPSVRRELILKLLGLDELERSRDLLKEHLDQINNDRIMFEKLKVDLNDVRRRIQEAQLSIERDEAELNRLEKEVKALEEDVKRYEELLELLKSYSTLYKAVEIVNEIKKLEQALPICKDILNIDIEDFISTISMVKEYKRELEEITQRFNEINDKLRTLVDTVSKELEIAIPIELANDSSKVIEILEDYIRGVEYEKSLKNAELSIATNSINIIEVSTKCPLCERELNNELKDKILQNMKSRVSSASSDIKRLERLYAKARKIIDEIKKLDRSRLELQAKIDNSKRHLENCIQRYRDLKDKVKNVLERAKDIPLFLRCFTTNDTGTEVLKCINRVAIEIVKVYEEKVSTLKRLIGDPSVASLDSIIDRYRGIKEDIARLGFDVDKIDVQKVESEYKQLLNKLNKVRELIGTIIGRLDSNKRLLDELKGKEKELEERLSDLKKSVDLYPLLDMIVNKFLGKDGLLAKILTIEARRLMEKYTNKVLKELGMDFSVKISDDFDIEVYTNYGEIDVKSLSGGETISLAIALRIALAYTVFGRLPGFFVLDEPTQFLDFERRRTVFEIIRRLSERVPQVIVVTHDVDVEELADKVFYVNKEGGRSIVREKEKFVEQIFKG